MSFITFKAANASTTGHEMGGANTALIAPKPRAIAVSGEEVGGGFSKGLGKGLGQGVGIGIGLLAFGATFAYLRGKRIG